MILYHGTTYNNFKSVFNDEEISVTTDENSHYSAEQSTRGYVCLTDSPFCALDFAGRCWCHNYGNGTELLTVIKVEIPDEELEVDEEETRIQSTVILGGSFYKLSRPVDYNTEVKAIAFFQFKNYDDCCKYYENHQLDYIVWSSAVCSNNEDKKWNGASGPMTPLAYDNQ